MSRPFLLRHLLPLALFPLGLSAGVFALRVDVIPSQGSFEEKPKTQIVGKAPGKNVFATGGNRGDWTIGFPPTAPTGKTGGLFLSQGIGIASLNELLPKDKRGVIGTGGDLKLLPGKDFKNGFWIAGHTSAQNGAEANYDFGLGFFRFDEGWPIAHIAADGKTILKSANLPPGTELKLPASGNFAGEAKLTIPGVDSCEDAMLFTISEANADDTTAVAPIPDGSGWYIRVADEGDNFQRERRTPYGFVLVPYATKNLIGGWIGETGSVLRGTGEFIATHAGNGRYEIHIPNASDQTGILLLELAKHNPTGTEDNVLAWSYDAKATGGKGAFVVESYDQPGFDLQNCKFQFIYLPYENDLKPRWREEVDFTAKPTFPETIALALEEGQRRRATAISWFSTEVNNKTKALSIDRAVKEGERLWLTTNPLGSNSNDHSVWAAPHFVLADGSRKWLSELEFVHAQIGYGKLQRKTATIAGETIERSILAHAPSLLCLEVPKDAVRFVSKCGLDNTASDAGKVSFSVSNRPYQRTFWQRAGWPTIKKAFPLESARMFRDFPGIARREMFAESTCRRGFEKGLDSMKKELGEVAKTLPKQQGDDLGSLLGQYSAAIRLLEKISALREKIWERAPLLSKIMDYPQPTLHTLQHKLAKIIATRPTLQTAATARMQVLKACEAERGRILTTAITNENSLSDLPPLAETLRKIAEWVDRNLGWTTYQGNNQRSAISRESLQLPLNLAWTRKPLAPPAPAWPPPRTDNPSAKHFGLSATLTYDRAFHPAIFGDRVVFASSSVDTVFCVNAKDGRERWRFPTQGPIRISPTIYGDRVYVGADDGFLYCLSLENGKEQWRYAPGQEDRRLMGNGRVISQWPIRCGICVEDGIVYFAAGTFPKMKNWLCAVEAETGKQVYRQAISTVPQGHLLLSPNRIFLPTGRTPFETFERQTGKRLKRLGATKSWGRDLPGGCSAVVVNETIVAGPGEGGMLNLFNAENSERIVKTPGLRLIVDGLKTYIITQDRLTAIERRQYARGKKAATIWSRPVKTPYSLLKISSHILVGSDNAIGIFSEEDGKQLATLAMKGGRVEGMAYHEGRLYAAMGDGRIHCFHNGATTGAELTQTTTAGNNPSRKKQQAEALAQTVGNTPGWIFLDGADQAELGTALLQESCLRLIIAERDPEKAQTLRKNFSCSGQLGTRIAIHTISGKKLPYRSYLFNLVIAGNSDPGELLRITRPAGGILATDSEEIFAETAQHLPGGTKRHPSGKNGGFRALFQRGPLPGGGDWTHCYADPANTACSGDQMDFREFEILWFGRPGTRNMYSRHIKAAPPLYHNGTVFITGKKYLAAADAYNGAILWEKQLDGVGRPTVLKDCGNMATGNERLYIANNETCSVFAARSGKRAATFPVPIGKTGEYHWGYIALWGNLLLGSARLPDAKFVPYNQDDYNAVWYHFQPIVTQRSLFALDNATGEKRWSYTPASGVIAGPTITILDNAICFVESKNPETRNDKDGKIPLAELFKNGAALTSIDLANGRKNWSRPIDLSNFHHVIYMAGAEHTLILTGSRHDMVKDKKLIQYELIGIDAQTGNELWRNDNTGTRAHILNGGHGEQTQHPAIMGNLVRGPGFTRELRTGRMVGGWQWNKSPQCATLSTSAKLAFSRQGGNPTIADFSSGKQQKLTTVSRPGCWINTLPVGGLILIPEASSGCSCGYAIRTTLALAPVPGKTNKRQN